MAINAAAGIVITQATTILPATPQRTADTRDMTINATVFQIPAGTSAAVPALETPARPLDKDVTRSLTQQLRLNSQRAKCHGAQLTQALACRLVLDDQCSAARATTAADGGVSQE